MVKKKGKSKRVTLKDKYKIQRLVVAKNRKDRKNAKKAGGTRMNKGNKDPGIPNSWPFKDELLSEIEASRIRDKETKAADELARREANAAKTAARRGAQPGNMKDLMDGVMRSQENYDNGSASDRQALDSNRSEKAKSNNGNSKITMAGVTNRRMYLKDLKSVISSSDILLMILDARDPMSFRSKTIEEMILTNSNKRLVFILNKVDLIPSSSVQAWLDYLRRSHPTIAIKASTGSNSSNNGRINIKKAESVNKQSTLKSTKAVGVDSLIELLKNYSRRSTGGKSSITVGVIGYPNVGKSSIINSLLRSRSVCSVSSKPGHTKVLQEVQLDKGVVMIDSPGVVFDDTTGDVLLRNCVDPDSLVDPLPAIAELMKKVPKDTLMRYYNIPTFADNAVEQFLGLVAKHKGRIIKGGIVDKGSAGRGVIKDWNSGAIGYYTKPPTATSLESTLHLNGEMGGAVKVEGWGEVFDVNKGDEEVMKSLEEEERKGGKNAELDYVCVEGGEVRVENILDGDGDEGDMEEEEEEEEDEEDWGDEDVSDHFEGSDSEEEGEGEDVEMNADSDDDSDDDSDEMSGSHSDEEEAQPVQRKKVTEELSKQKQLTKKTLQKSVKSVKKMSRKQVEDSEDYFGAGL